MVEEILRKNNLKITKHRIEVYNIIKDNDLITLKDIYNKLNIDKVTIYRIIKLFLKNNLIIKNIDDLDTYYSVNLKEHSHYMTCTSCHKKIKIDICPIEDEIEKICDSSGFELKSHSINLEGLCKSCK